LLIKLIVQSVRNSVAHSSVGSPLRRLALVAVAFILCALGAANIAAQVTPDYNPPPGYYDRATGLTGNALHTALHDTISNHTVIPYDISSGVDGMDALVVLDETPGNSNNIDLLYSAGNSPKSQANGSWNREHTWPRSRGIDTNGPDNADLFHLRPCDANVNSARGNKIFDISNPSDGGYKVPGHPEAATDTSTDTNSWEPPVDERGDIARGLFYMDVCYDGGVSGTTNLVLTNSVTSTSQMGILSTLMRWHREDPVSERERRRNHLIYTDYQHNRNPFIDNPDYAELLWGGVAGPTPTPSATATPTVAPLPTATPNPNITPVPTATASPTATPQPGGLSYTQDFNTTPGASGTTYPDGWTSYNNAAEDTSMTLYTSSCTAGANYNFTNRIGLLGSSSNFDVGSLVYRLPNTLGQNGFRISYQIIKIVENTRSHNFDLEVSTTSATTGFSAVVGGTFTSGTLAAGTTTAFTDTLLPADLANRSGPVWLRWSYRPSTAPGTGSRDALALDNVRLTWNSLVQPTATPVATATPLPTSTPVPTATPEPTSTPTPGPTPTPVPKTLVVNTVADTDDGTCNVADCSLREAISAANLNADTTTINFQIGGTGAHVISLQSPLPAIQQPVIVDGYSQPGSTPNTLDLGNNASVQVVIDGNELNGNEGGLRLQSGHSRLVGLALRNFTTSAALEISGPGNNFVQGCLIGTAPGQASATSNLRGIYISASDNLIGGQNIADRNLITNNGTGVVLVTGRGNELMGNLIYGNDGLGIDINDDASTLNDAGDVDGGANGSQNYPTLTTAASTGLISGMLNSAPQTEYRIEYFAVTEADASDHGEGELYLGAEVVTTDGNGNAVLDFIHEPLAGNYFLSATATNVLLHDTSEFAICAPNNAPVNQLPGPQAMAQQGTLTLSRWTDNGMSMSDPDSGSNPLQITLTAPDGMLTLASKAGLVFQQGDGTADASMVMTGPQDAINAALEGLRFVPAANYRGLTGITIVTDDQGFQGLGGGQTDSDTLDIFVEARYSVSGRISTSSGQALPNARVVATQTSGSSNVTVFSNSAGYLTMSGLPSGTYTLTPTFTGYTFTPATRSITVTDTNLSGQNFIALSGYNVSGRISNGSGVGLSGINVMRTGSSSSAVTNGAGYFTFSSVPNGSYTVTPNAAGQAFAPASRNIVVAGSNLSGFNFTASSGQNLSGRISDSRGMALANIRLQSTLPSGQSGPSVVTNSAGYFTFANLAAGQYMIAPQSVDWMFTPSARTVVISSAVVSGINFMGVTGYSVSGRIATSQGIGLANIGVLRSGSSVAVLTNGAGYYTFTNVANGTYSISPTTSTYSYTPASRNVVVAGGNLSANNFTALSE